MINRGFAGIRSAMPEDRNLVRDHLLTLDKDTDQLIVGCCIGIESFIMQMGYRLGFKMHGVVPFDQQHVDPAFVIYCSSYELMPDNTSLLDRDRRVVELSTDLTAFTQYAEERVRSGTWATVRYAREAGIPVKIIPLRIKQ